MGLNLKKGVIYKIKAIWIIQKKKEIYLCSRKIATNLRPGSHKILIK